MSMANWTSEFPYEEIVDVDYFFHEMSITDDGTSGLTLLSTSSEVDCSDNELTLRSHAYGEGSYHRSNIFPQFAPSMPTPTNDHCYSSLGFNARGTRIQKDSPKDVAFVNSVNVVRTPEKKQPLDSKPQRSKSKKARRKLVRGMNQYDMELLNSIQQVSAEPVYNSTSDVEKKHLLPFDRKTRKNEESRKNALAGYTKRWQVRSGRQATGQGDTAGRRRDREREVKRYEILGDAKEQEVRQCKKKPRQVPTTLLPRSKRRNMSAVTSSAIAAANQDFLPLCGPTQNCIFPSFNLSRDQPKRLIEKGVRSRNGKKLIF